MKILVTGATGWLGTRLVETLIGNKRQVRCLVLPGIDAGYFRSLGAEIFVGDLRSPKSLAGSCQGVRTVFHCAGMIHPKKIKDLYAINTEGTKNILSEAIASKAEKFIYVSSNSVCGYNASRAVLMDERRLRPYMNYGLSKYKAEESVNKAFKEGLIRTTIIRPCWFYGVNQPERQTRFFRMISSGKPIMFGNGSNLRSMSYIDNVIQGLFLAEEKNAAAGQTYWIADKRPYTVMEIYRTIAGLLHVNLKAMVIPGVSSKIFEITDGFFQNMGLYSQEVHVAGEMAKDIACSIEKAEKELGYKPTVELEEGMRRSIEWCRARGVEI